MMIRGSKDEKAPCGYIIRSSTANCMTNLAGTCWFDAAPDSSGQNGRISCFICTLDGRRSMREVMVHKNDGFTLLEAMLATLILAFVLTTVLATLSQCARSLTDIRRTARASQILQQEMECIRLTNVWTGLTGLANTTFSDPTDTNHVYAGTISETTYSSFGTTTTIQEVTLTLVWTNQVGNVRSNELTALVGYGGLNKYVY